MEQEEYKIDLGKFNSSDSKVYSGQNRGKDLRSSLTIEKLEKRYNKIIISIPEDTFSVNPSFFLGFLGKSVKTLGEKSFKMKYKFVCTETIMENISEGIESALKYSSVFD